MAQPDVLADIARLDAEAATHKREERRHRREAQEASRRRDDLIAWCIDHGIPVKAQPGKARPQ